MTNKEFAQKARETAARKTYYIKGGFGLVLNASGKKRAIKAYKWNADRADKINALDPATFGFDCCGLVKGIIWGFDGNLKKTYGGAEYEANGLKDLNEKGLFNLCQNITDDLNNLTEGDFLYMPGHCGIYLGDGYVCESTPAGSNGVQITSINKKKWKAAGELPFIYYTETTPINNPKDNNFVIPGYYLKVGSRGMSVYNLQKCLNALGSQLECDGVFGPLTRQALINFQKTYNLIIDGIYGPQCQRKIREVLT